MTNTNTGYNAQIIADSTAPNTPRLTTMLVTFPRQVLAEFNTHRVFSRNSASSRAIPVAKQLKNLWENPYLPTQDQVGHNKPGMQSGEPLTDTEYQHFIQQKKIQLHRALIGAFEDLLGTPTVIKTIGLRTYAESLTDGITDENTFHALLNRYTEAVATKENIPNPHKEIVSRYLEPYMWHEVIVTATEWDNFFALRTHPDADPKIRRVAVLMEEAYKNSVPRSLSTNQWHTPLLNAEEQAALEAGEESFLLVSAGRCARLSYLTHHGTRDLEKDIELAVRLEAHGHMSPFEHVAKPLEGGEQRGNLIGWEQLRASYQHEDNFAEKLKLLK